jgi:hypothetical protein
MSGLGWLPSIPSLQRTRCRWHDGNGVSFFCFSDPPALLL